MAAVEVQNGNGASDHVESKVAVTFSALMPKLSVAAPKGVDAVQFYKAAFGAEEVSRTVHPKRKADQELPHIISARLKVGSTIFIVSDSDESASQAKGGCVFCLETDDIDAAVAKAVAAGAVEDREVGEDGACCGGRVGKVTDPYGFAWLICTPAKKPADVAA